MKRRWQLFWILEIALTMVLGYQIVTNPGSWISMLSGLLALLIGVKGHFWRTFWLTLGAILVAVGLFINPTVWIILFVGLVGALLALSGKHGARLPWQQKHYMAVHVAAATAKAGTRQRHPWFGDETIGKDTYEWDDINLIVAAGDTIIDLGNTLLPQGDSTIVIRKGLGKTRVLVPVGVGVMVDHSALAGTLSVDGKESGLHNQTVRQYSDDYDTASRRLHILTNVLVGDLEVLSV
ncbi:cell wall-active antibiotics response protein LiaF [Lacticaseibacillus jixianensis]|uniref:Cell wall-active antibiotics response protein LiaF n=1 Tax=Lacticaseibacillus jixianensis TaxID=2486012 RepID=A0ABW4BBS3_9LACO|nr:cell wall-active antibiotics response protein LiaF [Lacticaseibacillus jixianensis]